MKKVKFNIIDHRVFPDIRSALKMEIQAPVVQIDGPYHSTFVITCENLGVYKSRCIFIDFHPIADQLLIISPCQQIGIFLVRDMRQDQA